ncbi:hypothetical protein A3A09_02950 [Candidatus Nomurabacteria bacterium RIFCSPLOWO2_01_FULL_42_20]|uniref:Response regulatory domain-containing protein n=1 Tax=Candidatus Nomurabacteria bacterium RIFCSPHIGHO2_01_FULL_42_16 TaxID=1801743 RepID=A0A1F6VJB3_9BACT|nr:MAG: hypothetical protein A2824_03055 [Candidatus Nomurabacteria bacterium RIFCSPHIGHO2_01_FULL_42_16]OGI92565.1 MAG: hypothetical protein A3A09_02950 [Candidatus Nomurabacteria bacterium RIFCSPLOWO2_01_FULL_42_20]
MKKILIIEDETDLLEVLADRLAFEGFGPIKCKNGENGLLVAFRERPDLILLDIVMPGLDGLQVLKKLRADDWGKGVPVIILTNLSATDEKIVKSILEYRPIFYLVKSDWKIDDVVKKVKEVLGIGN